MLELRRSQAGLQINTDERHIQRGYFGSSTEYGQRTNSAYVRMWLSLETFSRTPFT